MRYTFISSSRSEVNSIIYLYNALFYYSTQQTLHSWFIVVYNTFKLCAFCAFFESFLFSFFVHYHHLVRLLILFIMLKDIYTKRSDMKEQIEHTKKNIHAHAHKTPLIHDWLYVLTSSMFVILNDWIFWYGLCTKQTCIEMCIQNGRRFI